jgi:hypothetical protein
MLITQVLLGDGPFAAVVSADLHRIEIRNDMAQVERVPNKLVSGVSNGFKDR